MDCITQARHNFLLAFQYCWNGKEFPVFREISVSELGDIHTGYLAIGLLDEALDLHRDFQEARDLRSDIWHAILMNNCEDHLKVEAPVDGAEAVHQSLGTELAFDIFLVLDGCEVRFVMEPV